MRAGRTRWRSRSAAVAFLAPNPHRDSRTNGWTQARGTSALPLGKIRFAAPTDDDGCASLVPNWLGPKSCENAVIEGRRTEHALLLWQPSYKVDAARLGPNLARGMRLEGGADRARALLWQLSYKVPD